MKTPIRSQGKAQQRALQNVQKTVLARVCTQEQRVQHRKQKAPTLYQEDDDFTIREIKPRFIGRIPNESVSLDQAISHQVNEVIKVMPNFSLLYNEGCNPEQPLG